MNPIAGRSPLPHRLSPAPRLKPPKPDLVGDQVQLSRPLLNEEPEGDGKFLGLGPGALLGIAAFGAVVGATQMFPDATMSVVCDVQIGLATGAFSNLQDPVLQERTEDAVDAVRPHFSEQLNLRHKVLDTPIANAAACPNGKLYFTRGLLEQLNDNELIFVAGHEVGHVYHQHAFQEPEANQTERQQNHAQEREADIEGVRVLEELGLSTDIAKDTLTKIAFGSQGSHTHPSLRNRLENIDNYVEQ